MTEDVNTIILYLFTLNFFISILVHITIKEASSALMNVIILALSVAIKMNAIMIGKT
ncbi:hypothetical protein HOF65_05400 [bacterium]|jgi:hypothetical protein|nr:hypothetical protein [bacterium]